MTSTVDVWTDPDLVELIRADATLVAIADALAEGARSRTQSPVRSHRHAIAIAAAVLALVAALAPAIALSKNLQTLIGLNWGHPIRIPPGPQVHATLTSQIPTGLPAGTRIRISWKLWSRSQNGRVVPFESKAIFARLVNPADTATSTASARGKRGHYTADLSVPPGGFGHIQIGITAERFGPTGSQPARFIFPISNAS